MHPRSFPGCLHGSASGDDLAEWFANPQATITRFHPGPGWMEPSPHLKQISESSLPTNNGTNRYRHVRHCGSPGNLCFVIYLSSTCPQRHDEKTAIRISLQIRHPPPPHHHHHPLQNAPPPPPPRGPPARPRSRHHHHRNDNNSRHPPPASPNPHRTGPLPAAQVPQRAHLQRHEPDVDQRHARGRRVALLLGAVDFCAGESQDLVSCNPPIY